MPEQVDVCLQGISSDLSRATGDIQKISMGLLSLMELQALFEEILHLVVPGCHKNECPPRVLVTSPLGVLDLMIDGGTIFLDTLGLSLNPYQATMLSFGRLGHKSPTRLEPNP